MYLPTLTRNIILHFALRVLMLFMRDLHTCVYKVKYGKATVGTDRQIYRLQLI